ncbi:MAG: hypothetical protein NTV49_03360, partial [Kiritimatiellaeota bacterium]|nr:hypothetical protein [Kiritimatiellota bacterium]
PLAVSRVVGFNLIVMRERRRPGAPGRPAEYAADAPAPAAAEPAGHPAWAVPGLVALTIITLLAMLAIIGYGALKARHGRTRTAHATLIPAESFAVLTLHPAELRQSSPNRTLADWLGKSAAKEVADAILELMKAGLDPEADVYGFAKFPADTGVARDGHPVVLCGFVARVTDPSATEAALSHLADQLSNSLRSSNAAPAGIAHSRMMIRCGAGRYLDPEGGCFTFGLRDNAAIALLELEGDPPAPRLENEMRLCLVRHIADADPLAKAQTQLPPRAIAREGALGLWIDAGKFFSRLPKNGAETARYQQLERHLSFELMLKVKAVGEDQLKLSAEYAYQADRFKDRQQLTPVQLLASLGPSSGTGLGGRLMERCADTLDYDSLIERCRTALDASETLRAQQVLVEKSVTSDRDARFTLSVRYNPQLGPPLLAAVQTLLR